MRGTRWLLLVVLAATLAAVGASYLKRRDALVKDVVARPKAMAGHLDGQSKDWCFYQNDGDRLKVKLCAKRQQQIREPSLWEFEEVELQLYRAGAKSYDLVKSAKAQFDFEEKSLYSDGDVEITMAVPLEEPASARLVKIYSSGVRFSSDTGKAVTDRAARFEFEHGSGSAVGAEYDPNLRELLLKSKVALDWHGKDAETPPMHLEAADAIYREHDSKIVLNRWSKLTRGTLSVDAGLAIVTLEHSEVRAADVQGAKGVQDDPGRKVEFAADELNLRFGDKMLVESIHGTHNARVASTVPAAVTTVTGDRMDLAFSAVGHESVLTAAVAHGGSVAESVPVARPGVELPETRTLRSDVIDLDMRPGGREIDRVETEGPATLDFTPNRPSQPKRSLKGDRVWIAYGPENRIQSFRSINVTTRTDQPERTDRADRPEPATITTRSREFLATFDPSNSQLMQIEQKTAFEYEAGDRQARGDHASLDQATSHMKLDGSARVWDPSGAASADHIELDQKSGDYTAEGRVATTREPEKKGSSSAILSNQEVLQGRAQKLTSTNRGKILHYEGNAVAWQGANRVEASRIDIDRERRVLEAHGNVVSQFVDRTAPTGKSKSAAPVFTVVRAADLNYAEESRVANYTGGVTLNRPGMTVTSKELKAFLNDSSSDNSLDKAFAEGNVKVVSVVQDPKQKRTRTGTSEHAEYYTMDQKVILQGGEPQLVDSLNGKTVGRQLTWFANNDRLLVDGAEKQPVVTTIRKK